MQTKKPSERILEIFDSKLKEWSPDLDSHDDRRRMWIDSIVQYLDEQHEQKN